MKGWCFTWTCARTMPKRCHEIRVHIVFPLSTTHPSFWFILLCAREVFIQTQQQIMVQIYMSLQQSNELSFCVCDGGWEGFVLRIKRKRLTKMNHAKAIYNLSLYLYSHPSWYSVSSYHKVFLWVSGNFGSTWEKSGTTQAGFSLKRS